MNKLEFFLKIYFGTHNSIMPPCSVIIFPTNKCNLKCYMCWRLGKIGDAEIPFNTLANFLQQVETKVIQFSGGGEPLLYPHIRAAMEIVKFRGFTGSLNTNGTLLTNHAEYLEKIGWDEVTVSIDGPLKIHDEIRGVKGTFRAATTALKKVRIKNKGIICTISKLNFAILSDIMLIGESLGVKRVVYAPQFPYQTGSLLPTENKNEAVRQLCVANDYGKSLGISTNAGIFSNPDYLEWINYEPRFCYQPFTGFVVDATGSARICCIVEKPIIGNVNNSSFRDIWYRNAEYEHIRKLSRCKKMYMVCKYCNIHAINVNNKVERVLRWLP